MCEKATYGYDFKYDGLGLRTLPSDETFGIGSDTRMPMDDQDYQMPSAFIGKLNKLTFAIEPPVLTDADRQKLQEASRAAQDAN